MILKVSFWSPECIYTELMEQEVSEQNSSGATSTTVDKAVRLLEALAASPEGRTLGELVDLLGTHRAPLYRILRSLEVAGFITRRMDRKYELGFGIKRIAQNVPDRITDVLQPWMKYVCEQTSFTGMLNVMESGRLTVRHIQVPSNSGFHVTTDVGYVYDMDLRTAPVIAALASIPEGPDDGAEVVQCRRDGYASTSNTLRTGVYGIAVPFRLQGVGGSVSFIRAEPLEPKDFEAFVPLIAGAVTNALKGRQVPA
jgi:DNA-binding IclR family transcriptional regulator